VERHGLVGRLTGEPVDSQPIRTRRHAAKVDDRSVCGNYLASEVKQVKDQTTFSLHEVKHGLDSAHFEVRGDARLDSEREPQPSRAERVRHHRGKIRRIDYDAFSRPVGSGDQAVALTFEQENSQPRCRGTEV
jgi:hypothetical protein